MLTTSLKSSKQDQNTEVQLPGKGWHCSLTYLCSQMFQLAMLLLTRPLTCSSVNVPGKVSTLFHSLPFFHIRGHWGRCNADRKRIGYSSYVPCNTPLAHMHGAGFYCRGTKGCIKQTAAMTPSVLQSVCRRTTESPSVFARY